ncbi:zinc finger protein ZFPM2b [Electrophorus electricus]|uniref:zinc finger protein ZFPM2b n=1 Tax=Electrophorus electricus TaxID=8005 RepID=UPI0015D00B4E|nr:zinc finger protein ZFPM2b [Electrophorus electricus]
MSRRKQSNPRQFKRALGNGRVLGEEACEERDLAGEEEISRSFSLDPDSFGVKEEVSSKKVQASGRLEPHQEHGVRQEDRAQSCLLTAEEWDGPRELEMVSYEPEKGVRSRHALPLGTTWGPFTGKIEAATGGSDTVVPALRGGPRWLMAMSWVSAEDPKSNCMVYSKEGHMWCSTTRNMMEGEELAVCALDVGAKLQTLGPDTCAQGTHPARLLHSIQLLPQQAAMASILPNAIVNKDIFPCKTCGIWFRSERNLQAHLMYYCSGRQRESETVPEKQADMSHQVPRLCTYPQCNMSFLGSHALEMHLSTHNAFNSEETPAGSSLKCTICDYTANTLSALQPHILSHLSQAGLRCTHCHFTFQTLRELTKHQELHKHGGVSSRPAKECETEHAQNLGTHSPKLCGRISSRKDIQESPVHQDVAQSEVQENCEQALSATKGEVNSGSRASFSYTRVKSEPSSPRLASSPIQHHLSPAFPMPPFMPHVPFSQDITAVPQASEILAKMSELVHRRLRHSGNSYPPMMYSTLVSKGATCFECNITFSNLDNYLIHKKHYCNSRWQHMAKPHDYSSILEKASDTQLQTSPKSGGSLASMLNAGQTSEAKGLDSTQFIPSVCDPFISGGKAPDEFPVQVKKASTPSFVEDRHNAMHLDTKSPKMSSHESEMDPSQTTCDACKITFNRHETFVVHKQYYCASRHDPPTKRANGNKSPANQKSARARKRRKVHEIPGPDQEQMGPQTYLGILSVNGSYLTQDAMESLRDQCHQRYNMIQGLVPKHPEPSLTVTKSALVSKCNAIAQEEGDAPIDLSKKCVPQLGNISIPAKGLMDYHECVVCKMSFNKVEDYLTHKQNFCPSAALDSKVPNIKKESSGNVNATSEKPSKHSGFEHPVQNVSTTPVHAGTTSEIRTSGEEQQSSIKNECRMQSLEGYPGAAKKMRADEQIWPYYEIKPADYATGMLITQSERRQSPNEGSEGEKDQPMPDGSHLSANAAENLKITTRGMALSLKDTLQLEDKPGETGTDQHSLPAPDIHCTYISPNPEGSCQPNESSSSSPTSKTDELSSSIKRGQNGPISTMGNVKYCRPCDIQFNNLSNFITHKKFYCSAHTTEHVK